MEPKNAGTRLRYSLVAQAVIYLLLALLYSLPGWSEWLQDKLNFLSTNLLSSTAAFSEHSLFQAGAFVLILFLLYNTVTALMEPDRASGKITTNVVLNIAYALSGLMFFVFSQHQMMHDLFSFLLFGGMGVWLLVVYRQQVKKTPVG